MVLRSENSSHNNAVMGVFIDAGKKNSMLNQFLSMVSHLVEAYKVIPGIEQIVKGWLGRNGAKPQKSKKLITQGVPKGR